MSSIFREAFKGYGKEFLDDIRKGANERISDAVLKERIIGIEKATISMVEAKVEKELIIKMLQKHWDLRLSEAEEIVDWAISEA